MNEKEINKSNFKSEPGIYIIRNLINNKVYVGQTKNVYKRLVHHKHELNNNKHSNSHLQRAINKYKIENFDFSVLEYCKNEELTDKEKYYLNKNNVYYNIRDASDSVIHNTRKEITEETRKLLSKANKGKIPKNLLDIQQKRKRKIAYYLYDELIIIFDSCKDAAMHFNMQTNTFHMYIGKTIEKKRSKYFLKGTKLKYYE